MKKIFFAYFLSILLLAPGLTTVQALGCPSEGLVNCGGVLQKPCTLCDLFETVKKIIDCLLFGIIPPLAVLMIVIGGIMYIVAHANPSADMLNQAKSLITAVVIGLFIAYGAWLIVNVFLTIMGVASWTGLGGGVWQLNCGQ